MKRDRFDSAQQLFGQLAELGNIHIECNRNQADELLPLVRQLEKDHVVGYVLHTDRGYERDSVGTYLRFWERMYGKKGGAEAALGQFHLREMEGGRIRRLELHHRIMVQLARASILDAEIYFLEDPLLNLDAEGTAAALEWMGRLSDRGIHFITANASMRYALLMPGTAFYVDKGRFCQVEQEAEELSDREEDEFRILKIAAKSGSSTLLFEPKDIDFVESMNKCNYISVRGTLFQVPMTMDEMEETLAKSGFFRCHRSYIVNMQKVEQIEKLSRNSYSLLLDNQEQSRIPLSKGRIDEMKNTFGW